MTQTEAAAAIGVCAATLRRWLRAGLVPEYEGSWTAGALGKARLIARLRTRGYSIAQLRQATAEGRLALGPVLELFDVGQRRHGWREIADSTELDEGVLRQLGAVLGFAAREPLSDADVELLQYLVEAVEIGFPLEAILQLVRVYTQAVSQIADAEVRLVHLYVHEPLMRSRDSAREIGGELAKATADLLPLAEVLLARLHRRLLALFVDQDVVGHLQTDLAAEPDGGTMPVAIAFADLAGFTELTEHAGDREAADIVERFLAEITATLPAEARVVKTIGDGVMIVGPDAAALADWAVDLQRRRRDHRPRPRIGVHRGSALYREGDYYGRAVNLAARVAGQTPEGRVLVTRPVLEAVGTRLRFTAIEPVRLKGFAEPTELFSASAR